MEMSSSVQGNKFPSRKGASANASNEAVLRTQHQFEGPPNESPRYYSLMYSDWLDMREIAEKLGFARPDVLRVELVKIDHEKLAIMLNEETNGMNSATIFFESIMTATNTHITWPNQFRKGRRVNFCVRIVGCIGEVEEAKQRVLEVMDSSSTRVAMKMNVSYTDHSYVIGCGGSRIKRITRVTETRVHFPLTSGSHSETTSNKVSLYGTLEGVERARALIHVSMPLSLFFKLPKPAPGQRQPNSGMHYVKMLEAQYKVRVTFKRLCKLNSTIVQVKGPEQQAAEVQSATRALIKFSSKKLASRISVQTVLQITPGHHQIVKGSENINILGIMERTKTKIVFPNISDCNLTELKGSRVTITGTIEGVCSARHQLLGNLPMTLIFDCPNHETPPAQLMNIGDRYGLHIYKGHDYCRYGTCNFAIIVRGLEKQANRIYEARHEILRLTTPIVKALIPDSYFSPHEIELNNFSRFSLPILLNSFPEMSQTSHLNNIHFQTSQADSKLNQSMNSADNNFWMIDNDEVTGSDMNSTVEMTRTNQGNNVVTSNGNHNDSRYSDSYSSGSQFNFPLTQMCLLLHTNYIHQRQSAIRNIPHNSALPQVTQQQVPEHSSCRNTSSYQRLNNSTNSQEKASLSNDASSGNGGESLNLFGKSVNSSWDDDFSSSDSWHRNKMYCNPVGRDCELYGSGAFGAVGEKLLPKSSESCGKLPEDIKPANREPEFSGMRTFTPERDDIEVIGPSPAPLASLQDEFWPRINTPTICGPIVAPNALGITVGLMDEFLASLEKDGATSSASEESQDECIPLGKSTVPFSGSLAPGAERRSKKK